MTTATAFPEIVDQQAWSQAHQALLAREKAHLRASDELAAARRRLPVVEITTPYEFETEDGPRTLLELFEGRRQLVMYHFMYGEGGSPCTGCSMCVDQMGHPAHLNARDTSRVLVSRAPLADLLACREHMGWTEPWVSSNASSFNDDFGTTVDGHETFRLSVFIRDGERVFLGYQTDQRGVEELGTVWSFLDRTPFGRQESWEDSPAGWPQGEPYQWWRKHDQY
jgi:predicted dithiol-disulfide oxidoreductase (DUF899 family)